MAISKSGHRPSIGIKRRFEEQTNWAAVEHGIPNDVQLKQRSNLKLTSQKRLDSRKKSEINF